MKFSSKLACVFLIPSIAISTFTFAETNVVERSSSITLSSLANDLYQRFLPQQKQLAQQQKIDANTELANAAFAEAATVNLEHYNDVIGSSDGFQEWQGSVDLPLWLPGQKQQQLALSESLTAELPANRSYLLLAASEQVRNLVWSVALAETKVIQSMQVWQAAQELEENVKSRVAAGELAGTEGLLAQSHVLEMQSEYLQAKTDLDLALTNYQHQTGQQVLPIIFEENLSIETSINQQHPYLVLLEQEINTLRTKQELARYEGAVNPSLSVGVRRERGGHDESFNHSVGVGINIALDDGVYRKSNIADASSALADASIKRQQIKHELESNYFRRLNELEAKQQQLKLIVKQEATAREYLLLQQRAFDLGEIDLVSLLRSRVLANDAHNRKISLQISIKHAISQANQALGVLL